MKRCYSLKKNRDFHFTYRLGKSAGCKMCTLVYVRDHRKPKQARSLSPLPSPYVRVGFCVSKKIGNSVKRNRAKRRLRAALNPLIPCIKPGYILIFIARAPVLSEPFEQIQKSVQQLIEKSGLINPA